MNNYKLSLALICSLCIIFSAGQVFAAIPTNDACVNAIPVGNVTNLQFDTTQATNDGPGSFISGANIWYCYTATCTGDVTISLCGSSYDTKLRIYSGCSCPATTGRLIAQDDDTPGICGASTLQTAIVISAVAGNQYLIEVGGYGTSKGSGVLSISCDGVVEENNDNIENAEEVGNVVNLAFNTTQATHDGPGECMTSPNIWYLYTPVCTGQATVSLCGSSFDTQLAIYTGTSSSNLTLVSCNDDSCGKQSELAINVTAGKKYWIEVGGYANATGQGILNISCNGQVQQAADLGDAPDSTNHSSLNMRAYGPSSVAHFPTVYDDGTGIYGPIHLQPKAVAYLGSNVTFETEADTGYDQDPTNNLVPSDFNFGRNRDLADDSINTIMFFQHCRLNAIEYDVTVVDPNVDMWVNIWFDWNRDGDWNDDGNTDSALNCSTCNTDGVVSEWAVQNQLLYDLDEGVNTITTPGFLAWYPPISQTQEVWMRITLSDEPFKGGSGAGGSGPAAGYMYGETEDYLLTPSESCFICEDLNKDGQIDTNDLFYYLLGWLDGCESN